jgi:hypothetical protein
VYGDGWVWDEEVPKPYLPRESDENEAGGASRKDKVWAEPGPMRVEPQ